MFSKNKKTILKLVGLKNTIDLKLCGFEWEIEEVILLKDEVNYFFHNHIHLSAEKLSLVATVGIWWRNEMQDKGKG